MAHVKQETAIDSEALIHRHQSIWQYLRYLGADRAESDDLTQETFLAFIRGPFENRGDEAVRGFLRQIARNQLLMLRRRQGKELDTVQLDVADDVWSRSVENNGVEKFLEHKGDATFKTIRDVAAESLGEDGRGYRTEFLELIDTAMKLSQ